MMTLQIRPKPGLAFILPLIAMLTKNQKCCKQMRFASIQYSAAKMQLLPGSAPYPAGGAYSASPDPLAGFKEVTSWH